MDSYIFFYGHHPRNGPKHVLSNWTESPFVSEKELANQINNIAVENLSKACKKVDSTLIHFSTDYVFNSISKIGKTSFSYDV